MYEFLLQIKNFNQVWITRMIIVIVLKYIIGKFDFNYSINSIQTLMKINI